MMHPVIPFFAAAVLVGIVGSHRLRSLLAVAAPCLALLVLLQIPLDTRWSFVFWGMELAPLRLDELARLFAMIFCMISALGQIYAWNVQDRGHQVSSLLYAGSAVGAVLAGDLLTLLLFWEWMAVTSTVLIWYSRDSGSLNAGFRYLLVHAFGGALFLGGLILFHHQEGHLLFNELPGGLAGGLILTGFAINAAIPPLHAWLPDAYPRATIWGSVFLSAFTTKTAVYVLARGYSGTDILIWAGALMAIYGVTFALLENDLRRLLSYHIVSQVGFMVCGIGLGSDMAVNGASAHAFCHILYKGLLFMAVGSMIAVTGKSKLTELGGLFKTMPWTFVAYMVGAFSISGVPLFNGFISKSMTISGAAQLHHGPAELLLTAASVGTFLSVGLKLPYYAFFGKPSVVQGKELPISMAMAMGIASLLCVGLGLYPAALYGFLPFQTDYHPYTGPHVIQSLQLLLASALVFWILLAKLTPKDKFTFDFDRIYRVIGFGLLRGGGQALSELELAKEGLLAQMVKPLTFFWTNPLGIFERWARTGVRSIPFDENRYRPRLAVPVISFLILLFILSLVYF